MRIKHGRPKGVTRCDRLGRFKDQRHGTRRYTSWRPEGPERFLTERAKSGARRR